MESKPRQNAYLSAAQREMQRGRNERAQQLLLRLLKTEPKNQEAWLRLADTFQERTKAIRTLQHLLELNPHHSVAQKRLAELTHLEQLANRKATKRVTPTAPQPAPATWRNWVPWLLIPLIMVLLLLSGAFVWLNQSNNPVTQQIELINDDANRPESLASLQINADWECRYDEALAMTEFTGEVTNRHESNAYESFAVRASVLDDSFAEIGSNVAEERNLNLAVGETAVFSVLTPNPIGSNICVIELIEAAYVE